MNTDLSIHRMAFRETDSLVVAQVLVAKKRAELDMRQLRERVLAGDDATKAGAGPALRHMEETSEALRHAAEQRAAASGRLDKSA